MDWWDCEFYLDENEGDEVTIMPVDDVTIQPID